MGQRQIQADAGRTSSVAKRAFFNIMEKWGVGDSEAMILLGRPSRQTFYNWKKDPSGKLSQDTIERISYIVGIYKALHILFPQRDRADAWVRKKSKRFGGTSALQRMLGGNVSDLFSVRSYLDHVRGGRA